MRKEKTKRSKGSRVRRAAENIIIACLAVIVVLSGWKVFTILRDYDKQQGVYDEIAAEAGFSGDIDFDTLRKINPDIVGWLYYEDSPINYPVVQGTDNDKYLTTMFDGTYGSFGTLFVDAAATEPFRQFNTIIYGHHMRNSSMFGSLGRLKDIEYAREHPRMELITPEGKYHLEIWAFLNQPADSNIYEIDIPDEDGRSEYISMIRGLAEYTTDVPVTVEDRLVELSTCAYEYQDARYVVSCIMTPW